MRTILVLLLVFALLYGISSNPAQAADTAQNIGGHISDGFDGLGRFVHDLVA
jgi:hypothetical protein